MTAKDLNLVTDPEKLAAWAEQNSLTVQPRHDNVSEERMSRPRADLAAVPTPQAKDKRSTLQQSFAPTEPNAPSPQQQSMRSKKETPHRRRPTLVNLPWLLTAAVAVVNMLFLAIAALWLTGTDLKGGLPINDNTNATTSEAVIAAMQESNTRVASMMLELSTLKEQLNTLEIEVKKAVAARTQDAASKPIAPPKAPEESAEPAAPVIAATKPITTGWQVNLGDYPSRKEARETQRILQKLGLETQMKQLQANGTTAYLVSISGFADRQDAEDVANEIMIDTQLNGLWVAKTP